MCPDHLGWYTRNPVRNLTDGADPLRSFLRYRLIDREALHVKNYVFKIIVAGDGGVGKTTLLHKYVTGTFMADAQMTIGVQFHLKTITIDDSAYILQLWDLGGQDRFRFMLPSYVLGAKGALLLLDTTRLITLQSLEEWTDVCRTHVKDLPILLCGTKVDLVEDRSVSPNLVKEYLETLNLFDYVEISAKTGQNVEQVFEMLLNKIASIPLLNSPNLPL
ncbi:MAG: small GTP-binding protein [Promethearchaeota archaeon CR_4]|nr:MAG: small GTP-binding protein [Candidatus Lokiarchaeota archaeon CR_4]